MNQVCPKGHFSTDADYCSECGTRLGATSAPPVAATSAASDRCPDCGTDRPAGARYCEVCRFDFQTQASFNGLTAAASTTSVAVVAAPVSPPPPGMATAALAAPGASATATRLLLRVVVDATLCREQDPAEPCPQNAPQKIFHLDLEENTLGRQYEGKGVHPEIVVNDPGISRRHLKFIRNAEGGFSVLELGSANGTEFNGKPLEAGVVTPVKPDDQLTLGMWTRMHVEAR
jgi:hypothetical protein